jgi:predicted patatin/cPLA2 family phospholipase
VIGAALIDVLNGRRARGSRAPHGDGSRVALAVEGGAMRGVVSAGMVSALEALGYGDAFDAAFGSSAGAINAAYFLAGQARLGTTIYSEDINNRRFIAPWRPLVGRPIVNLEFLIGVARHGKPLDTARVRASAAPLTVLATDVATASRAALRDFPTDESLLLAMRAGATMPVVAGGPFEYGRRRYLDASLTEPIPVQIAESEGFTHVLALLTRPAGAPQRVSALDTWYVIPGLRRMSPALARMYSDRTGPYAALQDCLAAGRGPEGRADVLGIWPAGPEVSKLERDPGRLRDGARQGFDAVCRVFGQPPAVAQR